MEGTLDNDHVVDFGLQRFKNDVEFPSTTTALVDHEFGASLEWSQRLESHLEDKRIVWAHEAIILLLKEY
jgi:hypothetical protein